MTKTITDARQLMMCPLAEDRICPMGGIEVDDPKCGPHMNMTYRACALWHGGMCDISIIAAQMMMLPSIARLLSGDIDMDEARAAAKHVTARFSGKEES